MRFIRPRLFQIDFSGSHWCSFNISVFSTFELCDDMEQSELLNGIKLDHFFQEGTATGKLDDWTYFQLKLRNYWSMLTKFTSPNICVYLF